MKLLIKSLVYSNLWVGFAVAAFCFITMVNLVTVNLGFLAFVTCSTAFTYNYMRVVQASGYHQAQGFEFKNWLAGHMREAWFFTLVFGALAFFFFLEIYRPQMIWLLLLPGLISLIYPLSFKRVFSGFTSLRSMPGLKLFLIAGTWSYVTVLVPVLLYGHLNLDEVLEFLMRTFLLFGLIVPFDIRDESLDEPHMRTIPQVMGIQRATQLAMFFVMLYQVWLVVRFFVFGSSLPFTVALLIGFEMGYWLIRYATPGRGEMYFSFWIEGVPIFCGISLLIARYVITAF